MWLILVVVLLFVCFPGAFAGVVFPELTILGAAAPRSALVAVLIAFGVGAVVLVPSLAYFYVVFKARPRRWKPDKQLTGCVRSRGMRGLARAGLAAMFARHGSQQHQSQHPRVDG